MTLEEVSKMLKQIAVGLRFTQDCLKDKNLILNYKKELDALESAVNYIENESIPKEKVREILKECQNFIDEFENNEKDSIKEYKQLVNDYDVGLKQGVKAEIEMWKKNKMEYVHKRNILMELLGE